MPHPEITLTHDPSPAELQFLDDRIYAHNHTATGKDDGSLFAFLVRGDDGELLAGLSGWTWANVCEIRILWVSAALRGQGLGAELLARAEAEARAKDCRKIILTTYSFQAPDFYPKYGFTQAACITDFPPGFQYYLFEKTLA